MSAWLGKAAQAATKLVHSKELRHDVALFVGALTVTGIIGDFTSGASLTLDMVEAAVIVAGRRAVAQRLAGK
jgi:hypothetical protein